MLRVISCRVSLGDAEQVSDQLKELCGKVFAPVTVNRIGTTMFQDPIMKIGIYHEIHLDSVIESAIDGCLQLLVFTHRRFVLSANGEAPTPRRNILLHAR